MTQCGGDLDFSMLRLCDIYLHCIRIISKYKKKEEEEEEEKKGGGRRTNKEKEEEEGWRRKHSRCVELESRRELAPGWPEVKF